MNTTATNRKIRVLLTAITDGVLIPQPEFQRRLVWSNKHKLAFLETVLRNLPFPEIYVAAGDVDPDTGRGVELLVDGQQRLTTLSQYFLGSKDLPLGKVTPYEDLRKEDKLAFLEYEVVVRDLGSQTLEEIKDVFRRINSTKYALNAMETHNSRFDGALKKAAEHLAEDRFFDENHVFQTNEVRRMADVSFALTLIITKMSSYFNRDDEFEEFLRQYNDDFPQEQDISRDFQGVFSYLTKCDFEPKSRAWKKADLLTLIVEIDELIRHDTPDVQEVAERTKAFYAAVDSLDLASPSDPEVASYYRSALQATNDKTSRLTRAGVLQRVLRGDWCPPAGTRKQAAAGA